MYIQIGNRMIIQTVFPYSSKIILSIISICFFFFEIGVIFVANSNENDIFLQKVISKINEI